MQTKSSVIRSFVRREGRFTSAQRKAIKNHWPKYGVSACKDKLDFHNIFQNKLPVVLDIGFGNGEELIELATTHTKINYLGVEVYRPGIGSLIKNIVEENIKNIRIADIDAVELLKNYILDHSLNGVLVWFPDPWPKKKHHKRRLIQVEFVKLLATKLIEKGELYVATDWNDYAEQMQNIILTSKAYKEVSGSKLIGNRPKTKFERRGIQLGHPVFSQVYETIN